MLLDDDEVLTDEEIEKKNMKIKDKSHSRIEEKASTSKGDKGDHNYCLITALNSWEELGD